ncbi:MAG: hypothetical protein WCF84_17295 [Anaerolineae bacterium]
MDIQRVRFLRQYMVTNIKNEQVVMMEFSYDNGAEHAPRFFGVPDQDMTTACALYTNWGGSRPDGYRRGTTVRMP